MVRRFGAIVAVLACACGGQSISEHAGAGGNEPPRASGRTGGASTLSGGATGSGGSETFTSTGGASATGGVSSATGGVSTSAGGTGATGGTITVTGGTAGEPCTEAYEDRDGDGWSTYYVSAACGINVGTGAYWEDCDDSDPSRQATVYPDNDADGAGAGMPTRCVADGYVPPGYSSLQTDCDDADPSRSPLLIDTPGDGIDQDCDLRDAVLCTSGESCPCDQMTASVPAVDETCDGFDLTLLDTGYCRLGCGSDSYLRIANLGTRDFTGTITLTQTDAVADTGTNAAVSSESFSGTIAAGAVTAPRRVTALSIAYPIIMTTSETGDCDPSNDSFVPSSGPAPVPLCK